MASRPSVHPSRLSVCDVEVWWSGHIGWNYWKIISRLISPAQPLLSLQSADPNTTTDLKFGVFPLEIQFPKGTPQILAVG